MADAQHAARKLAFIHALAHFLVHDQARKSIELSMGKTLAKEWAALRNAGPSMGWANEADAAKILIEFLGA